jgi:Na+/melibiose symporter-like transporter
MKPIPLAIMSVGTAIALGGPGLTIGRSLYFRSMGIASQPAAESQIALMTALSIFAVMLGGLIAIGGYVLHRASVAEDKKAVARRIEQEAKREARQAKRDARDVERLARRRRDPVD